LVGFYEKIKKKKKKAKNVRMWGIEKKVKGRYAALKS